MVFLPVCDVGLRRAPPPLRVRANDEPTYPGKLQLPYAGQLGELSQVCKFIVILLSAVRGNCIERLRAGSAQIAKALCLYGEYKKTVRKLRRNQSSGWD